MMMHCRSLATVVVVCWVMTTPPSVASEVVDTPATTRSAPHGTPFDFEVVESHDALYLGDTPAHVGRAGGLAVRPNVALGDPVYRKGDDSHTNIGRITRVVWSRVSGSLEVEFRPEPFERVAVGDRVWIDLNPMPVNKAPAAVSP